MAEKRVGFKVGFIILLSVMFVMVVVATVRADPIDPHQSELLRVKDEVITTLKWVGGIIITAMASTVGLLYRDLSKTRGEVTSLARRAIEAIEQRLPCHGDKREHKS